MKKRTKKREIISSFYEVHKLRSKSYNVCVNVCLEKIAPESWQRETLEI